MRVVEYGHIKPKEVKCNHCGAILEYVNNDVKQVYLDVYAIQCPICNKLIYKDNDGKELTK